MNSPTTPRLPEPPFSAAVLAHYDAGTLPAETAAHIALRLPDDPDARRILDALAATRAALAAAPVESVDIPPTVAARLQDLLRDLGNNRP